MNLRHCHVCGPTVQHGALLMHRLDGYMSAYDRVVWLCGRHWAEAQEIPGVGQAAEDGPLPSISEPVMVLAGPDMIERVLEAVA